MQCDKLLDVSRDKAPCVSKTGNISKKVPDRDVLTTDQL